MPRLAPLAAEVEEALDKVLDSEAFARSGRARDLLRYLVEREQAGESEALKGYAIALDVFGRTDEFDPSTDAVVRVQATRLRDLLTQYYEGEGAGDRLRIVIPRGGYVPSYSYVAIDEQVSTAEASEALGTHDPAGEAGGSSTAPGKEQAAAPAAGTSPVGRSELRLVWIAMSAVAVLLAILAYRTGIDGWVGSGTGPETKGEVAFIPATKLPSVHVSAAPDQGNVDRVAAILRVALAGFDTIEYVDLSPEEVEAASNNETAFQFGVSQVPGETEVSIALQHAQSSRNLVTREVDPVAAEDMIADILTSVAPVSGAIYAFLANNGITTPLITCLLENDYYYRDPGEEQFIRAFDCMTALEEEQQRSPLIYSELASLELQGIVNRFEYAEDFTRDRALECARRAIQMGPTSPYAHRAYGYLLQRMGNESEGLVWMRKAYELNVFDLSMAASFAYALVFSGAYSEAVPVLERAVRASSARPGWWDYSLFLAAFMLDEDEKAANATLALETTKRAHYLAARMIVAHRAGDQAKADQLRSEIIENYPVFAANPRQFFIEAEYPADLTDRLTEAISAAGLVSAS